MRICSPKAFRAPTSSLLLSATRAHPSQPLRCVMRGGGGGGGEADGKCKQFHTVMMMMMIYF
jgi:hypothetical protein